MLPVDPPPAEALTRRELEIVQFVAQGLTNMEIAQRLVLETGTVANHVQHIMRKLDVRTRVRVATWAVEQAGAIREERILALLRRLQRLNAPTLRAGLTYVAQLLSEVFAADKVDVFVLDEHAGALVAFGVSPTPMGHKERALGLDRLRLAAGGRAVSVFMSKAPYQCGHVDQDPEELQAIRVGLGVRSTVAVPVALLDQPLGVLMMTSAEPERFSTRDTELLAFVAHWLSLIAIGNDLEDPRERSET